MTQSSIPNNLKAARLRAGMATPDELAERAGIEPACYSHIEEGRVLPTREEMRRLMSALGDVPASDLYMKNYRQVIGVEERYGDHNDIARMFRNWRDTSRLLIFPDEVTWFERQPGPDHRADVYLNGSCSTQISPHLLLDTVSVFEALGVSFVAAAGPGAACCGKPIRAIGRAEAAERHSLGRVRRSRQWGATVHVNWCTACQLTTTTAAARRRLVEGTQHPVQEIQVLTFLERRVRELGDRMPWKKQVRRRVLAEGHASQSPVHQEAQEMVAHLLALVPGVEVIGLYDGYEDYSPCTDSARESPAPDWTRSERTREDIRRHRKRLAEDIRSRGADTVSCQHMACHQTWSRYAGDGLRVQHAISILAEALGCAHPDRHQQAVQLGDPRELLEQTRPIWQAWGMSEKRALELATSMCDPRFAASSTHCACGTGQSCGRHILSPEEADGATERSSGPARPGG